jgi:signal transduction histidine kinase
MRPHRQKHSFFWQGVLIVVPVAVLAGLGLISLRQDKQLAAQEAQQRARELVQQLSTGLGARVASQLFQSERTHTLPFRPALLSESGSVLFPLDWTSTPSPPDWLQALQGEARSAWDAASALTAANAPSSNQVSAWEKFLATGPHPAAQTNARLAILEASCQTNSTTEAVEHLCQFGESAGQIQTESGLPIAAVAFGAALARVPADTLNDVLLRTLGNQITNAPCVLTSYFLAQAEARALNSPGAPFEAVRALWQVWDRQEAERALLGYVRQRLSPTGVRPTNFWLDATSGRWLVMVQSAGHPGVQEAADPALAFTPGTLVVRFFPKEAVEQAFAKALRDTASALPGYFTLRVSLVDEPLDLPNLNQVPAPAGQVAPLAQAVGTLTNLLERAGGYIGKSEPLSEGPRLEDIPTHPAYTMSVCLSNPALLYSRQRQRTLWFGALILGVALTACIGFVRARRAFLREHELNELRTNFVSSVSHELRAPIASVRLMAESLERGKVRESGKQQEYFHFIVQECRRLSSLIANVLDFSRIEQGRKEYELEPTDVHALVEETVKLMEPYAMERGVTICLDGHSSATGGLMECGGRASRTSGDTGAGVSEPQQFAPHLDGRAIQQALINLLDNAIKHSPKGATVTIGLCTPLALSSALEGPHSTLHTPHSELPFTLRLWVEDHGPGIPKSEQQRIFERFYRLGSELRRETQGIGIGLSIVKHIVEGHRGQIIVESEPGQGSRFTIEIPV